MTRTRHHVVHGIAAKTSSRINKQYHVNGIRFALLLIAASYFFLINTNIEMMHQENGEYENQNRRAPLQSAH